MDKTKVVVIGAGNVASAFVSYISAQSASLEICCIYSRRLESIKFMEEQLGLSLEHVDDMEKIPSDADIYLFCITDDALEHVLRQMPMTTGVWIHTSGCNSIDIMKPYHNDVGVLYPLQTISKKNIPASDSVPIFLESSSECSKNEMEKFARILFRDINYADSCQRKALHLAAVFACNFTNHMYAISDDIINYFGLPQGILGNIIRYTASRIEADKAANLQTGPAFREDSNTISIHRELMKNANPNIIGIYDTITKSIIDMKKNKWSNYFKK